MLKFLVKVFLILSCYENNLGRYVVGLWSALWHSLVGNEVKVSMTHISWSSDFALYLEDNLMYEHHTLGL